MKVIVAGAAGFIGSHLVERLLIQGDRVLGIDSMVTGVLANLSGPLNHINFSFLKSDLSDPEQINSLIDFRPDAIVNLACPASPDDFLRIPEVILHAGSSLIFNLVNVVQSTGARLIFASSSEVYGDPDVHPQDENYPGSVNTTGPRSCYDESKRFAEAIISSYGRSFGLRFGIARIFNTYGPRMRPNDGRVVSNFLHSALKHEPLVVYGSGEQTRSFCFVDDTVTGLIAILNYSDNLIVNLGNPEELSVTELAKLVISITESRSSIEFREIPASRIGDPRRRKPDISRARQHLGWVPGISVEEGLRIYAAYLAEHQ